MKKRSDGFLSEEKINHNSEQFGYIIELHDYLWEFVRCELPAASGKLTDYLNIALENAKRRSLANVSITMQTEKGIWKISNGKGDRIYINCTDESKIMHPQKLCGTGLGIYGYKHLKDLAIAILLFEKEKQNQQSCLGTVMSRFSLHIHNDIEHGAKWFKIPLVFWNKESVYIMQEDRCVFVGTSKDAQSFYEKYDGKYCKSKFPLNDL